MTQIPIDGGPVYAETNLTAYIAEPWNAFSSLAIILPAIFWAIKLKGKTKTYTFLYSCIPLLLLGGIGSTLYHASRSSNWLLIMDVLPAVALTIAIGTYFWLKVVPGWWQAFSIVIPFNVVRFSLFEFMSPEMAVNIGYFISGAMFFLPVLMYLNRNKYRHRKDILLSILFLGLSLLFRNLDHTLIYLFPMGSHFLWHLLSGIGAYFMANYLYKLRQDEIAEMERIKHHTNHSRCMDIRESSQISKTVSEKSGALSRGRILFEKP